MHLGIVREVREEEWEVGTNALFVGDSTEVEIPDDSVLLVWIYVMGGAGVPSSVGREAVVVQDYFLAVIHFAYFLRIQIYQQSVV